MQFQFKIKDKELLRRYQALLPEDREKVDQTLKRHFEACAKHEVEPEPEPTLREAIDLVSAGNWEPDRKWERPQARWHYDTYVSPIKEAA